MFVLSGFKVLNLIISNYLLYSLNTQVNFVEKPQLKIISFLNINNNIKFVFDQKKLFRVPL